jgi:hypothetical protein
MPATTMPRTSVSVLAVLILVLGGVGWSASHVRAVPLPAAGEEDWDAAPRVVGNGFPRRLLVVAPSRYVYASPVAHGAGDLALPRLVHDFAGLLRVPDDQTAILSDRATDPLLPSKGTIQRNVARFLASCRPGDRAVVLFVGRAVEKDGKVYFLPIEGEADNIDTLIPLDWFYDRFAACRAQQKVFIVDVCRFNPRRNEKAGTTPPMSESFEQALRKAPAGVQVVATCAAGQFSCEANIADGPPVGLALHQIAEIAAEGGLHVVQKRDEPIPVADLTRILEARTKGQVESVCKTEQQVWTSGSPAERAVAFDADRAAAPRFALRSADVRREFAATKADIQRVLKIALETPSLKGNAVDEVDFDFLPPYPANALDGFVETQPNTPLRLLVLDAVKLLQENAGVVFPDRFNAPPANQQQVDAFKAQIVKIGKDAALVHFKLSDLREEMLDGAIVAARAKESKYWRAAYDYTLARLHSEIAYYDEYGVKLAEMRREFPERDPNLHSGWRLASREKMDHLTEKEANKAREILAKMADEFKGTPWEVLAKRDRPRQLGLEWRPVAR